MFSGFGNGDCLKYYEAIMTDPVLKVTPLHAFSHMCSKFFLYPLNHFGRSLSEFVEHITCKPKSILKATNLFYLFYTVKYI